MEKPIKIAFVGTTTIGKTTLIEHYKDRFASNPHVALIDEAGRVFFEKHKIRTEDRLSYSIQRRIQTEIIKNEQRAHSNNPELILCDRSVLDAIVYCQVGGDFTGSNRLWHRVRNWIPSYTHILLLDPTGIPFQPDQIRQENLQARQNIHDTFESFFQNTGIPYTLLNGTLEEKISFVDDIINKKKPSTFY